MIACKAELNGQDIDGLLLMFACKAKLNGHDKLKALLMCDCRSPLPPLFMRFTIQTLNAAPRLKSFVLDILSNLVNKQVSVLCPHLALLQ